MNIAFVDAHAVFYYNVCMTYLFIIRLQNNHKMLSMSNMIKGSDSAVVV